MTDDINELRAEVLRRQKAANAKVARLTRKGVNLSNTKFDVRRNTSLVGTYNKRQLNSYLDKLNSFVHRSNAFVGGSSGTPIRRSVWSQYRKAERSYNDYVGRVSNRVDAVKLRSGNTVGQRKAILSDKHNRGIGNASKVPFNEIKRHAGNVTSEKAALALARDLDRKRSRKTVQKNLSASRRQFARMAKEIGDPDLARRVSDLTDYQFDILWNYEGFASDVSQRYEIAALTNRTPGEGKGNLGRAKLKNDSDAAHEIGEALQWAELLPKTQQEANKLAKEAGNKTKKKSVRRRL